MTFIHLRTHTAYSLAEGAIKIKQLAKQCDSWNIPAVGITDTANLFGSLENALALKDVGVQAITGCQIYVDNGTDTPDILPLFAMSELGYQNLMFLSSEGFLRSLSDKYPVVSLELVREKSNGLIALTGGVTWASFDTSVPTSGIQRLYNPKKEEEAETYITELHNIFQDRLYIEITRHDIEIETVLEPFLLKMAEKHTIPIVATNHNFFLTADQFEAHDALLAVAETKVVEDQKRRRITSNHRFKTADEMKELFFDLPEAIENTVNIAKRCHYLPPIRNPILPSFAANESEELQRLAREGLDLRLHNEVFKRFPTEAHEKIRTDYTARLEMELGIIIQMEFPGYFLIVSDFIQWSKRNNIPVGPGRGSGAGSLVAWSLTITDMDPIRFGLIFERFLNPERVSMPDFDVDFCQERRDEVIHYVQERYGKDRVAQIITFGKLQAKAVLRDVGRVLQLPYSLVDKISKLVPAQPNAPVTLAEALEIEPQIKEIAASESGVDTLLEYSLKLEGLYRHASTHAAGLVIGDRPLHELVPMYRDPSSDIPVSQFSMKYVELAGLVKFDFLGLKTLTVIQHTIDMLAKRGIEIDISKISLDDKKTFDLLTNVDTVGVFQLESSGMKDVLRKLKPDTFEDIIALVALYRPGPMDDIPRYIACKHGEQEITYAHPATEPILKETFGVMVYQEQVMHIAQKLGGYSLGEADLLRRAMGKKIKEAMDAERARFVSGCERNNIATSTASHIFDLMAKFASYGFNKSHSAPYALLAYQTAYLKANYPIDFFAATMSLDINHTEKLAKFAGELRRMKLPLLAPDFNASQALFDSEKGTALRYSLSALKGVGTAVMEIVVTEREKNGPYKDIHDFVRRLDSKVINKRILESLIQGGVFDTVHPNRRELFENIELIAASVGAAKQTRQGSLFGGDVLTPKLKPFPEWTEDEKLKREKAVIGFYLSSHPLDGCTLPENTLFSADFEEQTTSGIINTVGVVQGIKYRLSKKGSKFAFLELSDPYGSYEVSLFSDVLEKTPSDYLSDGTIVLVSAHLRVEEEGYSMIVNSLKPYAQTLLNAKAEIIIEVQTHEQINQIYEALEHCPEGTGTVIIRITHEHHTIHNQLPKKYNLSVEILKKLQSIHKKSS